MMYCSVKEAYDSPLSGLLDKEQHKNKNRIINNCKESWEDKDEFSFFSTQGSLMGTSIEELKNKQNKISLDDLGSLDTSYSILDKKPKYKNKNKYKNKYKNKLSHKQCINKFIKSITSQDDDLFSIVSSHDDDLYDHIKSCKYCRTKINMKMKSYYVQVPESTYKSNNASKYELQEEFSEYEKKPKKKHNYLPTFLGHDSRDIIITAVIIILILLIIDIILKLGKTN